MKTLKAKEEIKSLFQTGKKIKAKHITLVYATNKLSINRYVFCSDRYARKAHDRNRIKRVLRALVFHIDKKFPVNMDIALIANTQFTQLDFQSRLVTLKNLFFKIQS